MRFNYKHYFKQYGATVIKDARDGKYPCFYCGMKSESIDHFIPQSFIENIRNFIDIADTDENIKRKITDRQVLIPACLECNSIANDALFDTPDDKKSYVKAKIRKKYDKVINLPDWKREELDVLGYVLRVSIESSVNLKQLIRERIAW